MKTIFVDAWNTFVKEKGIDQSIKTVLDNYPNQKIIVTNANKAEIIKLGIVNMPYPVFSLTHNPDKTDPKYFEKLLDYYGVKAEDTLYFEHNEDAVKSAKSVDIKTLWFQKNENIDSLKAFLDKHL